MHFFFLCECRFLHFFPCIVSKNLYLNWNLSSCCFDIVIRVLCSFSEILDKPQFLADVVGSSDRVESPPRPFSQSIMSRNPFPSQVNSFFLLVFRILLLLLEYNVFQCISLYADPVLAIFNLRHNNSYLGRNIHGQSNEREPSPVTRWYLAGSRGLSIPCLLLINHANGQNLDCKCFALQRFYGAFERGRFKGSKMQSL